MAEIRRAGGRATARPAAGAASRPGRWTERKRQAFLAELAVSANVRASARSVAMSESGAYALRKTDPAFREAWQAALAEGYAKLEIMLLERAFNGTVKTVTTAGGKTSRTREYSERLALALLAYHRDSVGAERVPVAVEGQGGDPAALLIARLAEIRARMARREAAAADPAVVEADGED